MKLSNDRLLVLLVMAGAAAVLGWHVAQGARAGRAGEIRMDDLAGHLGLH